MIIKCCDNTILVSDSDCGIMTSHKWQIMLTQGGKQYVRRTHRDPKTGKHSTLLLHRVILDANAGDEVDHINGNGLDNRRENLRIVTSSQQRMNSRVRKNKEWSSYKGVSRHIGDRKYVTQVMLSKRHIFWREYNDEAVAAWMYDIVANDIFGEYANLNFMTPMGGSG